jgi:hypothetical protein
MQMHGHDVAMPEKTPSERLDDCEDVQKKQQTELVNHGERLRALEAMELDSLQDDFRLLMRFSDIAFAQIKSTAEGAGPSYVDPALREKCRAFVEKYSFEDRYRL